MQKQPNLNADEVAALMNAATTAKLNADAARRRNDSEAERVWRDEQKRLSAASEAAIEASGPSVRIDGHVLQPAIEPGRGYGRSFRSDSGREFRCDSHSFGVDTDVVSNDARIQRETTRRNDARITRVERQRRPLPNSDAAKLTDAERARPRATRPLPNSKL